MKFLRTLVVAAALLIGIGASAQTIGSMRLGLTGGYTSSGSSADFFKSSSSSLYHAGVTFECPLVGGFAIQPSVLYQVKGVSLDGIYKYDGGPVVDVPASFDTRIGYVEIPVQIQWGPDLLAFRPYLFAEPFVGFAVNTANQYTLGDISSDRVKDFHDSALQRLEYGVAAGLGIEFSRFQVSGRYYWNMGSLYNESGSINPVGTAIGLAFKDGRHFNGFSVSLAVFF